jgi:nucleoside-diphosphate-sugar epimerase
MRDDFTWKAGPTVFDVDDMAPTRTYTASGFGRTRAEMAHMLPTRPGTDQRPGEDRTTALDPSRTSLVVGGAGFMGSRLVRSLLADPRRGPVVVASRNPDALRREWTQAYGAETADLLWNDPRLSPLRIDISATDAAKDAVSALSAHEVGVVHNLAARMDAFAGYERLRGANVDGTSVAALIARTTGARLVQASTLSVFVSSDGRGESEETWQDPGSTATLYGGYAQTKAMAEELLAVEAAEGLDVRCVRYGLLVPEHGRLLGQDHFMGMILKALADIGVVPEESEEALVDLTRVDQAAEAAIAIGDGAETGVFHYANPVSCTLTGFVGALDDALKGMRRGLTTVDADVWKRTTARLPRMTAALLEAAFHKKAFMARTRTAPFVNVDLFQSTDRHYEISRSLHAGAAMPEAPETLIRRLARPFAMPFALTR